MTLRSKPLATWVIRYLRSLSRYFFGRQDYSSKMSKELNFYRACENVHDLPEIFHYWSNKYLVPKFKPFGFSNPQEFFCLYMKKACVEDKNSVCRFVSIGSGNCDNEVDLVKRLLTSKMDNFTLECLDINAEMLERGKVLAQKHKVLNHMRFSLSDINYWKPNQKYKVVIVNQALHHFLELELLFKKIYQVLDTRGYFIADDIIGRNGHMRWPEAYGVLSELWKELPETYKYNHQLKRLEIEYENWDCSTEGFEGIRSQDILPLLIETFHFDFFIAFANVIDVFVDRCFGHNFNPNHKWDCNFIDKVHAIDEKYIESGILKPTHMMAAMTKTQFQPMKIYKHLSPKYCVRS